MHCDASKFDQKLLGFWFAARDIYNTATGSLSAEISKLESVKVISFFVQHSFRFADASLMLAANDDVLPAIALMRTAIESQARANHIISFNVPDRESKAAELFRLFDPSRRYHDGLVMKSIGSVPIDWANVFHWSAENRAQIVKSLAEFDLNKLEALRKERETLRREWEFGKMIDRKAFGAQWNPKKPFEQIQQILNISFNRGSFALHPDLMSLQIEKMVSSHEIMLDAATVAVSVVYCYLVAIGSQDDLNFKQLVTEYADHVRSKISETQDRLDSQASENRSPAP